MYSMGVLSPLPPLLPSPSSSCSQCYFPSPRLLFLCYFWLFGFFPSSFSFLFLQPYPRESGMGAFVRPSVHSRSSRSINEKVHHKPSSHRTASHLPPSITRVDLFLRVLHTYIYPTNSNHFLTPPPPTHIIKERRGGGRGSGGNLLYTQKVVVLRETFPSSSARAYKTICTINTYVHTWISSGSKQVVLYS